MRHSGHVFRWLAVRSAAFLLLLPVVLAAGTVVSAPVRAAEAADVTGLRLGRHAGFLRLVFDLTAPLDYDARATGRRTFEVSLPNAALPPEGHAALAGDPLAPDLIVRPATGGGPLRFRVASRFDAFIRRAFLLDPPKGGGNAGAGPWRLVLDIVPRPGQRTPAEGAGPVLAALPPLHGIVPDATGAPGPVPRPAPLAETPAAVIPETSPDTTHASGPAQVEVSWARASRILRELQDHQAPEADLPPPPQLVLPPKYRRSAVPLR
jgi:hypothetical protein